MTDDTVHVREHPSEEVDEGLLARVPEEIVPLGAGCLAAATGITLIGALFGWYAILTGRMFGYESFYVWTAAFEFTAVTGVQAVGTFYARRRIKWMWTMLAAIIGMFTFIVIPLSVGALICLGLGKYHFSGHTPLTKEE
jgi:hypothetical protein